MAGVFYLYKRLNFCVIRMLLPFLEGCSMNGMHCHLEVLHCMSPLVYDEQDGISLGPTSSRPWTLNIGISWCGQCTFGGRQDHYYGPIQGFALWARAVVPNHFFHLCTPWKPINCTLYISILPLHVVVMIAIWKFQHCKFWWEICNPVV